MVAKFLAKRDANWHRVETCRVPLPRLVSPRERRKEKKRARKRERKRKTWLGPPSRDRSSSAQFHRSPLINRLCTRVHSRRMDRYVEMRKRIATGSYPSPSPLPRAPFAPPTEDRTRGGRLDGGALFTVPEHVATTTRNGF